MTKEIRRRNEERRFTKFSKTRLDFCLVVQCIHNFSPAHVKLKAPFYKILNLIPGEAQGLAIISEVLAQKWELEMGILQLDSS